MSIFTVADHGNKVSSLYVKEPRAKKDGTKSQKLQVKPTRSGKPTNLAEPARQQGAGHGFH